MFYKKIFKIVCSLIIIISFSAGQTVEENLVTIDAEDANLATVLSIIAQDSEYNIVTGPAVSENKKLTIHFINNICPVIQF